VEAVVVRKTSPHKSLTIEDVEELGAILLKLADDYPLQFRTEKDFFPLVRVFLEGRVPSVAAEVGASNKKIDFRIGGPNPALLELAVAPRALTDPNCPDVKFPGHNQTTQLYASANKAELDKLRVVPQAQAKNRYLLLLDLGKGHDTAKLRIGYDKQAPRATGSSPIRVVYVGRQRRVDFRVGGK
jgi:hypothetical protein